MPDDLHRSHDVFISHSSRNSVQAMAVCAGLEQLGLTCWIAPRNLVAGLEYEPGLVEAIRQARMVLFIFSEEANRSAQVAKEMNTALQLGRPILPFCIEGVEMNDSLFYQIGSVHRLYGLVPPVEQYVPGLADAIRILLRSRAAQGQPETVALDDSVLPAPGRPPRTARGLFIVAALALLTFSAVLWTVVNRPRAGSAGLGTSRTGTVADSTTREPARTGVGQNIVPAPPVIDSSRAVPRPMEQTPVRQSDTGQTPRKPVNPAPRTRPSRVPATDPLTCQRLLERLSLGNPLTAEQNRQLRSCSET